MGRATCTHRKAHFLKVNGNQCSNPNQESGIIQKQAIQWREADRSQDNGNEAPELLPGPKCGNWDRLVSPLGPWSHRRCWHQVGCDRESEPGTAPFRRNSKLLLSPLSDYLACGEMLFLTSTWKILFIIAALLNLCVKG